MQCEHTKPDGEQCRVTWGIHPDSGRCFCHCPVRADQRAEGRRRGQLQSAHVRRRSTFRTVPVGRCPAPPQSAQDAQDWASWLTVAVTSGQVDARTGKEAATALRVFLTALDKSEMQRQIGELQAVVRKLKGKR